MSPTASRGWRAGFTLIELLATILVMSIVLTAAINFYLDLSHAAQHATDQGRVARRAAVLIDRIARDFEQATLVIKPPATDPIEHPWLFLAEGDLGAEGSDRLKFVTWGNRVGAVKGPASDLEQVAWQVARAGDGTLELRRSSVPQLPERLDRDFPRTEDTALVAEGLASFAVRMLDEEGEWVDEWDSSTLSRSSQLPLAVEIALAFEASRNRETLEDPAPRVRRVVLPLRPIDLEALLFTDEADSSGGKDDGEGEEDEGDEDGEGDAGDGVTVAECLAKHPELARAIVDFGGEPMLQAARSLPGAAVDNVHLMPPGYLLPQDCQ